MSSHCLVAVLGDYDKSPRMQNHVQELKSKFNSIDILSYGASEICTDNIVSMVNITKGSPSSRSAFYLMTKTICLLIYILSAIAKLKKFPERIVLQVQYIMNHHLGSSFRTNCPDCCILWMGLRFYGDYRLAQLSFHDIKK